MIHTTIHRELKIEQLEPKVNESAPGGGDSFRSTSSINRVTLLFLNLVISN
jgi:hypothetical protein